MLDWVRKLLGQKKAPSTVLPQETVLGPVTFSEGMWTGKITMLTRSFEFVLAGDESGPDQSQLLRLLATLARIDDLEKETLAFAASGPEMQASDFTIQSLNFLWPKQADYFMIYLSKRGDDHGLWKVEYVEGKPKFLSRDD